MKVMETVPPGWTTKPLWALFERKKDVGHPDEQMLSVFREYGVVPKDSRPNLNVTAENRDIYQLVDDGWLVINRMKAWQGSVGVSSHRGIVSGHYICFRPTAVERCRDYLNWLLRSALYTAAYQALSRGVRPGQAEIDNDQLRILPVLLPPVEEQQRIARFLSHRVSLLDEAIVLREQQIALLRERYGAYLAERYVDLVEEYGAVRLGLRLRGLEQGWSPQCEDRPAAEGEFAVLKAGCVNGGEFKPLEHKALPVEVRPRLEYLIKPGDLLMSRASGSLDLIGSIATVPDDAPSNLILCDKVYRLVLDGQTDPRFVAHMLRSHPVREAIKLGTSGAEGMANNLPSGTIRALALPAAPLGVQVRVVEDLDRRVRRIGEAIALMQQSLVFLTERKHALIAAAVTGEFDVTTARGVA